MLLLVLGVVGRAGVAAGWVDPAVAREAGEVLRPVVALVVAVLVLGPAPRWATRPAWLWALLLPWGAGALLVLVVERPWSERALRLPEPVAGRVGRRVPAAAVVVVLAAVWLVAGGAGALAAHLPWR